MHMLFLLTAVLTSHPLVLEASVPAHLEGRALLRLPASQAAKFSLLATNYHGQSVDHGGSTRYLVEILGGAGLGLVGTVFGIRAIPDYPTLKEAALPMALWVVGNGVGVTLSGWALDGRGSFGFAMLGSVIGFAAPFLVGMSIILASGCDTRAIWNCSAAGPMIVGGLILTPLVAGLTYELSAPTPWLEEGYASRSPGPAPRFVPVLTLARQGVGGTLGIAGRL